MEDFKRGLNDEQFQNVLTECVGKVEGVDKDWQDIIDDYSLGIHRDVLRKAFSAPMGGYAVYKFLKEKLEKEKINNKIENNSIDIETKYKNTIELNKDGSQTSDKLLKMSEEDCKDTNYLLKAHGYDIKSWELVSARNNIWNAYSKQDGVMTLYSSKISVKPRVNDISIEEIKEWFNDFDRNFKTVKKANYEHKDGDLLFEFPLVDLHFGKRGYLFEVGQDSDSKTTENNFFKVIGDYKSRLKDKPISRIVFPIGNDFFNSDLTDNSTTRGTRQDNDMRWKEMFRKGLEMIIQGIDMLSEIAPVDLIYVEGNHDTMTTYHLFVALQAYYRNDDTVNIIDNAMSRQYYRWGNCLIGYAHGDTEGKRIFGLMQKEQPKLWGETIYREWHLGHLHHEIAKEENGVVIRHLPTITGTDAWHYNSGYVGALQRCQAFIWDKEKGMQDIMFSMVQ
jgi:hypothetical protein